MVWRRRERARRTPCWHPPFVPCPVKRGNEICSPGGVLLLATPVDDGHAQRRWADDEHGNAKTPQRRETLFAGLHADTRSMRSESMTPPRFRRSRTTAGVERTGDVAFARTSKVFASTLARICSRNSRDAGVAARPIARMSASRDRLYCSIRCSLSVIRMSLVTGRRRQPSARIAVTPPTWRKRTLDGGD